MRNLDFWASAWRLFTWWKKEKIQIETRRVFTKYPSELLQDDAATSSSQHERWAKEGDENDGHLHWPISKYVPRHGLRFGAPAPTIFEEMKQRVAPCVQLIDPNAGNITSLMAADLSLEATGRDRALLPSLDFVLTYGIHEITVECENMLRSVMKHAQKQHTHNLKANGMVDILVQWSCADSVFGLGVGHAMERTILARKRNCEVLKKAWECHYKDLDWERQNVQNMSTLNRGENIPRPMLGRKGGFYAVVTNGLYKELKRLADVHLGKVDITVLMEPKCMTIEEKAEMEKYHARRTAGVCSTSSSADSMAKMKEEREREEREYRLRKKNTFTAACRRDVDKYEKLDLRVGYNF